MKKLTCAQFSKGFAPTVKNLKPGQSVTVTKRGREIGTFTKAGRPRGRMPNGAAAVARHPYKVRQGDALIQACLDDLR